MQRPIWKANAQIPDNSGPTPGECMCAIRRYYNDNPIPGYPAHVNVSSEIFYKVDVQTPNGPVTFDRVIPSGERPPHPWLIEALKGDAQHPNGRPVLYPGSMMDGAFYLHVIENRWAAPCSFTPGGA